MNDNRGYGISLSRNQMVAAVLMLGYVVLMSFVPLFVAYGGGDSPFIFNAALGVGMSAGCAMILLIFFRGMVFSGEVWKAVLSRALSLAMILWVVGSFDLALYAWSTQFIDVVVAAALFEVWLISLVVLTGWLFREEGRYRRITPYTIFLFVAALIGIASVIVSQAGGIGTFILADTGRVNLAIGVALALGAAGLATLSAYGFRWAADLASVLPDSHEQEKHGLELFCVIVGIAIRSLVSLPFVASVGFMRNEPMSSDALIYGVAGGLLLGCGTILWRRANLISTNLGINMMRYLPLALALGWLFAFSQIGDINVWRLLSGVALIILANIGMYLETHDHRGVAGSARDMASGAYYWIRMGRGTRDQSQESDNAQDDERIYIDALIAGGESDIVEFKSTLRVNLKTGKNDKDITLASLKTIAAFLNTRGGTLIIGVADDGAPVADDDGEPVGIAKDKFRNEDRMELHLTNLVNVRMDMGAVAIARGLVRLKFYDYRGSRVLAVRCEPATQATYVNKRFYIRTGPATIEPSTRDAHEYIRGRFPS